MTIKSAVMEPGFPPGPARGRRRSRRAVGFEQRRQVVLQRLRIPADEKVPRAETAPVVDGGHPAPRRLLLAGDHPVQVGRGGGRVADDDQHRLDPVLAGRG